MLCWEKRHRVLWVSLVLNGTAPAEFWASSIPAGVGFIATGNTKDLLFVGAGVSTVRLATGSTSVLIHWTVADKMPPFHALDRLPLLLRWPNSRVTNV